MKHRLLAAAVLFVAGTASAQKQQPGLWEIAVQMKSASGQIEAAQAQMREQLKSMPPDQRKMMEEMMAKQGIGGLGSGTTTLRMCVTKEQADRSEIPQDPNGNCKHDVSNRSAAGMKFSFACTNPPSKGSGEIVFSGDKAYTMKMQADTTTPQGRPERMEMQHTGRWLGADCGTLKR